MRRIDGLDVLSFCDLVCEEITALNFVAYYDLLYFEEEDDYLIRWMISPKNNLKKDYEIEMSYQGMIKNFKTVDFAIINLLGIIAVKSQKN